RASTTVKYFAGPAQRATRKPAVASSGGWVGSSRSTKRTRPVSTNFCLKAGKTFVLQSAQWLQVTDAYSITVTLALAGPIAMSPSAAHAPDPTRADARARPAR